MPESKTPMGRSIAVRAPRRLPLEAAIELGRALDFFRLGISPARETLADCSRSGRCSVKDMLMHAGGFHAQVSRDFGAGFFEALGQRPIKTQAQRGKGAKAAVGGKKSRRTASDRWGTGCERRAGGASRETTHADERDLWGGIESSISSINAM